MSIETLDGCKTWETVKTSANEYAFEAEEKSTIAEIKNLICKSNALKHAATENQNLLDNFVKKRRLLIEKKRWIVICTKERIIN